MKKILIVGAGSYVGTSFEQYIRNETCKEEQISKYMIHTLDAVSLKPEMDMFTGYDVIFFVAGIVHKKETKKNKHLYYQVNRDLAIAVAEAAKNAGAKQFIIMSTMAVYGMNTGYITKTSKPIPITHYGKSKLQADRKIWRMRDHEFRVAVLRPPMVYGQGCKGNYQLLRKFAVRSPIFPKCKNKRSMIYIGNLCEFVKRVIDEEKSGIFFPQNKEYVRTSEMVRLIAKENGKRIMLLPLCDFLIRALPVDILQKVFGDLIYEDVDTVEKFSFEDSIRLTESKFGLFAEEL